MLYYAQIAALRCESAKNATISRGLSFWSAFLEVGAGASAALAGLIIVGVSISLARIVSPEYPALQGSGEPAVDHHHYRIARRAARLEPMRMKGLAWFESNAYCDCRLFALVRE
jgi:hypothetical protein